MYTKNKIKGTQMYSKSWTYDFDAVMIGVEVTTIVEVTVGTTLGVIVVTTIWGSVQSGEFSSPTMAHKTRCLCKLTNGKHIKMIKNRLAILVVTKLAQVEFIKD
jgi:hypothetical protein